MSFCYGRAIQNTLLLQRNINRYNFIFLFYTKISATQEKKMLDEQCSPLVILMIKQQQPENILTKTPENTLPRKTIVVNQS